jgi:hypothetical protein
MGCSWWTGSPESARGEELILAAKQQRVLGAQARQSVPGRTLPVYLEQPAGQSPGW